MDLIILGCRSYNGLVVKDILGQRENILANTVYAHPSVPLVSIENNSKVPSLDESFTKPNQEPWKETS